MRIIGVRSSTRAASAGRKMRNASRLSGPLLHTTDITSDERDLRSTDRRHPPSRFAPPAPPARKRSSERRTRRMRSPEITEEERAGLAALERRIGRSHLRQRLGIEHDHEAQIFRKGTHLLHLENW